MQSHVIQYQILIIRVFFRTTNVFFALFIPISQLLEKLEWALCYVAFLLPFLVSSEPCVIYWILPPPCMGLLNKALTFAILHIFGQVDSTYPGLWGFMFKFRPYSLLLTVCVSHADMVAVLASIACSSRKQLRINFRNPLIYSLSR